MSEISGDDVVGRPIEAIVCSAWMLESRANILREGCEVMEMDCEEEHRLAHGIALRVRWAELRSYARQYGVRCDKPEIYRTPLQIAHKVYGKLLGLGVDDC